MEVPMSYYLTLSVVLFGLGLFGVLKQSNAVRVLMSVELMLNAVNLNLVTFAHYLSPDPATGYLFTLFVLVVAAAEAAVGLALVVVIARKHDNIDINKINLLKG